MKLIIALSLLLAFAPDIQAKEVVCYVPTYDPNIFNAAASAPCTQVIISFAFPNADGTITPPSYMAQYKAFQGNKLLGIGGWNDKATENFVKIAASPTLRSKFAQQCLDLVLKSYLTYGYTLRGIDIDWEYPADAAQKANFVLLMQEIRNKFGLNLNTYWLTTAVPGSAQQAEISYDIPKLRNSVTFFNVMTYDFHSDADWDKNSGVNFNSALYDAEKAIQFYLKSIPSQLLMVGIPFYGRKYKLSTTSKTLGSPFIVGYQKNFSSEFEPMYHQYCSNFKNSSWTRRWDSAASVPYMFDTVDLWLSYENQKSVAIKADLANKYNLGGVMIWSLQQDDYKGSCSTCKFPLSTTITYVVGNPRLYCNGPPTITICPSTGSLPHPGACNVYYYCAYVGAYPVVYYCPYNKYFNPTTKACDSYSCIPVINANQ